MEIGVKRNIRLLNTYMTNNMYLSADQRRNDAIRTSLSWKLTKPIRFLRRYRIFLKKKVSYCLRYREWLREFPQFSEKDREILSKFENDFEGKVIVVLLVKRFDRFLFENFLTSLKKQSFDVKNLSLFCHDISEAEKEFISQLSSSLGFQLTYNQENFDTFKLLYLVNLNTIVKENFFSVHMASSSKGVVFSYSDDEWFSKKGALNPFFKPSFSLELLKHIDYLQGGICIHDIPFFEKFLLKSLRQTCDLRRSILRHASYFSEKNVVHIPFILSAISEISQESCFLGESVQCNSKEVSIIIPTKNYFLLNRCLESILRKTSYNLGLINIIIMNNGIKDSVIDNRIKNKFSQLNINVIRYNKDFNFSEINNIGFLYSSGNNVVFLNDDTRVLDEQWLYKINTLLEERDVGIVGCKLLFNNGRVQHNGCVIGGETLSQHVGWGLTATDRGYWGFFGFAREVTAVTGACMAMRREVFQEIHKFDEELRVSFNDIALCMQSRRAGYRNIVISDPLFVHYESVSRGLDLESYRINRHRKELEYIKNKFPEYVVQDQFYNDNLSLSSLYQLAYPPRRKKMWRHSIYSSYNNIMCIYDDYDIKELLENIFINDKNTEFCFFDDKNNNIYDLAKEIFLKDVDFLVISSYNLLSLCDLIGGFCKVLFLYTFDVHERNLFFDAVGKIYVFTGDDFRCIDQ